MGTRIALCIDEFTLMNPETVGLAGERLDAQRWLTLYACGAEARQELVGKTDIEEVWVASCDDVEAINLAATLKADCSQRTVRLLGMQGGGSLLSRAHTASIDEVMSKKTFVERYNLEKGLAAGTSLRENPSIALGPQTTPTLQTQSAYSLARPPAAHVATHDSCFVMPVVSGSGGAGKSSIAILSAFGAHALGRKTLLLDYDLQFGDASVMAGVENPLTIDEALVRPDKIEQEAARIDRPALIAAPTRLELAEEIVGAVPELLKRLTCMFDVIIANTGAAWAEQHAALIERSSAVLFLVDQRASSIHACRHALELCARCGIATGQFRFALNRCAKNAPLTSADVSYALSGMPVSELKDGGRDVEDCLATGSVDELVESGNPLYASVCDILGDLLPSAGTAMTEAPAEQAPSRLLGRRRGRHVGKRKGWGK